MKSTERLQHLIYLLQSGKRLRVQDLAEEFGVNKRTIYRDFNRLSDLNIPITHDPETGYGIMSMSEISPIMFSEHELYTVIMGLAFVRSQLNAHLRDDAEKVSRKIKASLPSELRELMNQLEDKTVVDPFLQKNEVPASGGNWYTVTKGLTLHHPIEFAYTDQNGNQQHRTAEPLLLVYYYDHWNLIGFCHDRGDIRNFVLDRMESISSSEKPSRVNEPIDSGNKQDLLFRLEDSFRVSIIVDRSAEDYLLKHLPAVIHTHQLLSEKQSKIQFYFDNADFINNWLLQFADKVEILEPRELIELRKTTLDRMVDKVNVSRET